MQAQVRRQTRTRRCAFETPPLGRKRDPGLSRPRTMMALCPATDGLRHWSLKTVPGLTFNPMGAAMPHPCRSKAPRFQASRDALRRRKSLVFPAMLIWRGGPESHGPSPRRERAIPSTSSEIPMSFPRPGPLLVVEPWPKGHPRPSLRTRSSSGSYKAPTCKGYR